LHDAPPGADLRLTETHEITLVGLVGSKPSHFRNTLPENVFLCMVRREATAAWSRLSGSVRRDRTNSEFATVMGIIELFEITIAVSATWIIVSALVRGFRENRWLS